MLRAPLSRRRFLGLAATAAAGLGVSPLARPAGVAAQVSYPETRAGRWVLTPQDFQVLAAPDAPGGSPRYALSPMERMDFAFHALGATWGRYHGATNPWRCEFRTSPDGEVWSPWVPAPLVGYAAARDNMARSDPATDALGLTGRWVQVRVSLPPNTSDGDDPLPEQLAVTYVDGNPEPTPYYMPPLFTRAQWGADEELRFSGGQEIWTPEYVAPRKIVIHHTVTSNDDGNPAATVRAIYHYHAVTLGWGDIGYNYLVDQQGNIYEGRAGGPGVVAGHALGYNRGSIGVGVLGNFDVREVPVACRTGLQRLLRERTAAHAIDPQGSGFFVDGTYPNIMSHRDVNQTSCPGAHLHALLPSFRGGTAAPTPSVPDYRAEWVQHALPTRTRRGRQVRPTVRVRNTGGDTWTRDEPTPYRIAYRWYNAQGEKYNLEPDLEIHTNLPREVPPGEEVSIRMTLRAPDVRGMYHLKVDMVHEMVTWFEDAGSQPIIVQVEVR